MKKITLMILIVFLFNNCKKATNKKSFDDEDTIIILNDKNEIDSLKLYGLDNYESEKKIYDIAGENIFLREGAGVKYKKLINKKATDITGETQYMQVDYTCTVVIEEEKGDWAKIKIIDPSHLSSTHIGWIPAKNIIRNDEIRQEINLSKFNYSVISTSQNTISKNYNIYLEISNLTKDDISDFIKRFRIENCSNCTISIFDTKSVRNLINKYPLEKNEYLKFADHFVAWSTFDAPKMVSFYPFQDSKYKEYGGNNFKEFRMK